MWKRHFNHASFSFRALARKFLVIAVVLSFLAAPFEPLNTVHAQFVPTHDALVLGSIQEGFSASIASLSNISVSTSLLAKASVQLEVKETILDGIAFAALNAIISYIGDSIVEWIQNGFEGGPGFVTDPGQFFTDIVDQELGNFIASSDFGFLCRSFDINFSLALNLNFSKGRFKKRHGCTLSQVIKNTQDVFNRTSDNGWDGWISLTGTPQNNAYGAYVVAESEAAFRIGNKALIERAKLDWGSGFLSQQKCTAYESNPADPSNPRCVSYETVTPGSVVENQINDSLNSGKRRVEIADEINEIIGALINQLLSTALKGLSGAVKTGGGRTAQGDVGCARPPCTAIATSSLQSTALLANVDGSIAGTRGDAAHQANQLQPDPLPPPFVFTPAPTPQQPNQPPPPPPNNTILGVHLVNADIAGSLKNVNVYNMKFTSVTVRAVTDANCISNGNCIDDITSFGVMRARAGNVYLCPPNGCNSQSLPRQINIANDTVDGIEFTIVQGQHFSLWTTSGTVTGIPGAGCVAGTSGGCASGVWTNTVDTQNQGSRTVPTIRGAEIINARVTGNITATNLVGGQLTGTLVAPPEAHLTSNTTYADHGNTDSPPIFHVTQTTNVLRIESGTIRQGNVTGGTLTNGTPLTGWTVAYDVDPCGGGCQNVTGGPLSNIDAISGVVSYGGRIATGETTGEADVRKGGEISGTIVNQGTVVGVPVPP